MYLNNFMSTDVQKAFTPSVPGCTELELNLSKLLKISTQDLQQLLSPMIGLHQLWYFPGWPIFSYPVQLRSQPVCWVRYHIVLTWGSVGRCMGSDACPLCGEYQSLLHVLNHCSKALDLRRYTERHDSVLRVIASIVKHHLPVTFEVTVDLADKIYTFPQHICPVVWH